VRAYINDGLLIPFLDISSGTIISRILPPYVVTAEAFGDLRPAALWLEEAPAVERAVEKRRQEFAAGRELARAALAGLGEPPRAILTGIDREPAWPAGIVGSITHCAGYCAAAVARGDVVAALGIDVEPNARVPVHVLDVIARQEEREWIQAQTATSHCWGRLLFSAKESLFKAWFPLTRRHLDFGGARVVFDAATGTFHATVLEDRATLDGRAIDCFEGRYLVRGDHVFTAICVSREPPAQASL
jgi:4'-phosphopantetheinyl transferase EntD